MPKTKKTLTKVDLANIFGANVRTIDDWIVQGLPVKVMGGPGKPHQFDALEVLKWTAQRMKAPKLTLDDERAKLAREQTAAAALKRQKMAGSLIDVEAAAAVAQRAAFAIRQRILALEIPEAEKQALLREIHALGETDFTKAEDEADKELEEEEEAEEG